MPAPSLAPRILMCPTSESGLAVDVLASMRLSRGTRNCFVASRCASRLIFAYHLLWTGQPPCTMPIYEPLTLRPICCPA